MRIETLAVYIKKWTVFETDTRTDESPYKARHKDPFQSHFSRQQMTVG